MGHFKYFEMNSVFSKIILKQVPVFFWCSIVMTVEECNIIIIII